MNKIVQFLKRGFRTVCCIDFNTPEPLSGGFSDPRQEGYAPASEETAMGLGRRRVIENRLLKAEYPR
jgi:hypothetical protein